METTGQGVARLRDLELELPSDDSLEQRGQGPCTPTYEFPVSLPPHPRPMPDTPDVSRLSLGMSLTPSPQVTGKRAREEDEWDPADIEVLQNILSRPPKAALYPPGSMPPPTVLDELTTAVVDQLGGRERAGREGRAAIVVDDPMTGSGSSSSDASDEPSSPAWSHSWEDTRRMLTTLALEDTRLGAERADRKLSRQERLARPGVRRVDSMDFLNDASNESSPNERLGRVLRLSTALQNSAREPPEVVRAASMGAPMGSSSSFTRSTPPVSFGRPRGGMPLMPSPSADRPPPMRRNSSVRSIGSRRPSLLARGRSFTASDLEAELEAEMRDASTSPNASMSVSATTSPPQPSLAPPLETLEISPRRRASAPDVPSMRLLGSYSSRGRSHDCGATGRPRGLGIALGLPPAPVHGAPRLGAAFDPSATAQRSDNGWDSDSDHEDDGVSVKRRARRPHLAMTTMSAMSTMPPPAMPSPLPVPVAFPIPIPIPRPGPRPTLTRAAPRPKLVIDNSLGLVPALGSPFEEHQELK